MDRRRGTFLGRDSRRIRPAFTIYLTRASFRGSCLLPADIAQFWRENFIFRPRLLRPAPFFPIGTLETREMQFLRRSVPSLRSSYFSPRFPVTPLRRHGGSYFCATTLSHCFSSSPSSSSSSFAQSFLARTKNS